LNKSLHLYDRIYEAISFQRALSLYSDDVRIAINSYETERDKLLKFFDVMVYEVHRDYSSDEILPVDLHEVLRHHAYAWIQSGRNR
jgi:hypothetical protein